MNGDLILPEILEENLPIKVSFKSETKSTQLDAKEAIDLGNEANTLYLASYQTSRARPFSTFLLLTTRWYLYDTPS